MADPDSPSTPRVALFQNREIRRILHNDEWWFVITDIVAVLTDSVDPAGYLKKMRRRDPDLGLDSQGEGQIVPPLGWHSIQRVGGRSFSAGTRKAFSA